MSLNNGSTNINKETLIKAKKREEVWGWFLVAPTLFALVILNFYPALKSLILSFQHVSTFGGSKWVGLNNYIEIFTDGKFWDSLKNTLIYTIFQVPITVSLSILFAAMLNSKIKFKGIYRTIFFLPMVAAPAAVAMIWKWLFNSNFGLINIILGFFNIEGPQWLSNPDIAIWTIIIVGIWSQVGYNMIILLGGLQDIPVAYYEAANIDGASGLDKFFKITLPLLSPQIFLVMLTSFMGGIQVFDSVYMMFETTNPAYYKVQTVMALFFQESFSYDNKGYGSAIAVVVVAIIMVLTVIQWKVQDKWVYYEK